MYTGSVGAVSNDFVAKLKDLGVQLTVFDEKMVNFGDEIDILVTKWTFLVTKSTFLVTKWILW